jgi:hypothetical protein
VEPDHLAGGVGARVAALGFRAVRRHPHREHPLFRAQRAGCLERAANFLRHGAPFGVRRCHHEDFRGAPLHALLGEPHVVGRDAPVPLAIGQFEHPAEPV